MSALTPEQWRELNNLWHAWDGPAGSLCDEDSIEARSVRGQLTLWFFAHGRTLIDAARPKCEKCDGNGRDYGGGWNTQVCSDCDGTGWAA